MKKYAHIESNEVTNVSLWDGVSPWEPGCEIVQLPDDSPVGPGWSRSGSQWIEPVPIPDITD